MRAAAQLQASRRTSPRSVMRLLICTIVALITALATFYFVFWVGAAFLLPRNLSRWVPLLGSAIAALVVTRYVWLHSVSFSGGLVSAVLTGAFVTAGIGFSAGFFGPMLLT